MKRMAFLCVLLFSGCPKGGDLPSPASPEPSAEMKAIVAPLVEYSDPDLVSFYSDFADVIERDSEIIKTTQHIREANSKAGRLMFQADLKGKYPGLADKVDAAIIEAIGKQNVAIDRPRTVSIFRAIAWAFE